MSETLYPKTKSTFQLEVIGRFNLLHSRLLAYTTIPPLKLNKNTQKSLCLECNSTIRGLMLYLQIKTEVWTRVFLLPGEVHLQNSYLSTLPHQNHGKLNHLYTYLPTTYTFHSFSSNLLCPVSLLSINLNYTLNVEPIYINSMVRI